jgi:hypothetical protein
MLAFLAKRKPYLRKTTRGLDYCPCGNLSKVLPNCFSTGGGARNAANWHLFLKHFRNSYRGSARPATYILSIEHTDGITGGDT